VHQGACYFWYTIYGQWLLWLDPSASFCGYEIVGTCLVNKQLSASINDFNRDRAISGPLPS